MGRIKLFFTSLFVLTGLSSFAQNNQPVYLKWKIKSGEVITYKTIMKEVDTANSKISFGFMDKLMGDSGKGSFKNMIREMRSMGNDTNIVTLKKKKTILLILR